MRWIALFLVCAAPALASDIEGKITLRGDTEIYNLWVGCIYRTASGRIEDSGCGTTVVRGGEPVSIANRFFKPRITRLSWNAKAGCTYRHANLRPGRYLVYVRSGKYYYDWQWVQIKGNKEKRRVDLTVDPGRAGTLEVHLSDQVGATRVAFLLLDSAGKVVFYDPKAALTRLSEVEAVEGRAVFEGLRAGRYRVAAGNLRKDVVVKAGQTTRLTLAPDR